MKKLEAT